MKKLTLLTLILIAGFVSFCSTKKADSTENESKQLPPKIVGKEVSYTLDTLTMKGYMVYDENAAEKRPGILVVHEWWGHNEYARERATMLAEMGYVAFAIDMYGDGKLAEHPTDAGKFMSQVFATTGAPKGRFEAALTTLKENDKVAADKIGAIGYCFGGSIVLSMANAGLDLDAVAAFHAGLNLAYWPEVEAVKAKVLVCNGADDPFIKEPGIANFKSKMDSAGADYKYISYDGAVHSFTSKYADGINEKFPQMPVAYHAEADSASWEEMKRLFAEAF